ncbi:speckle targeted PIP5K1A-regulated poly(A) polymerase-like isoform X2 [Periplaneta americana]|uniref:speckle targeted PIP5K1A-regulated poly(A) polymerase-like isoform X2 n=1 Tax=Periplaneta americana TaxID=6978 RepID=UPI0037E757B6
MEITCNGQETPEGCCIPGTKKGSRGERDLRQRSSAQTCLSKKLYFRDSFLQIKRAEVRENLNFNKASQDYFVSNELNDGQIMTVLSSCKPDFQNQARALMNEILLRDCRKYTLLCQHLEATLSATFPGCKAYAFGSTVTGLAFKGSDLDVYMSMDAVKTVIPQKADMVMWAKRLLYRNTNLYSHIIAIPKAKTPIVKLVHIPTGLRCDLSFRNALGVHNSALIRYLMSLDTRLRPLIVIIKYWARKNELTGHGKISNYALTMLVLFYLQQLVPSVIPPVAKLQENCEDNIVIDGWACDIICTPYSNANTLSVPELLQGFFKFCYQFDYGIKVICPLTGGTVPKSSFRSPDLLPEVMYRYKQNEATFKVDSDMCIQDPFELCHNLSASMTSRALHNFKSHCSAAAVACENLLASPSQEGDTPPFLWKLFHESSKPSPELSWSNEVAYVTILLGNYAATVDGDEDVVRRQWYQAVLDLLVEILEKVLRLETRVEEAGRSTTKVQKLDGQSDTTDNVRIIHCAGYHHVWEGRRSAAKKFKFPDGMGMMERECMISDLLMEKEKEQNKEKKAALVTSFECAFRPRQEPTRVVLEFGDKKSYKSDFKVLAALLQVRLPVWIEQCLKEQQNKIVPAKQSDV